MYKIIFLSTIITLQFTSVNAVKNQKGVSKKVNLPKKTEHFKTLDKRRKFVDRRIKKHCKECSKVLGSKASFELHLAAMHHNKTMMAKLGKSCPNGICEKISFLHVTTSNS